MAGRDGGSVISIDELSWEDQEVPDSTPLTRLVRLPSALADRGFTVVVRFPVGWTRPQAGHYVSTEEIYVLDGEVNLSARRYGPATTGTSPPGITDSTRTPPGPRPRLVRRPGPVDPQRRAGRGIRLLWGRRTLGRRAADGTRAARHRRGNVPARDDERES